MFAASRLCGWHAGVRFDAQPLLDYWQFLDPQELRGHLLRSLFYLHSQPPLFNLFLGVGLKLFQNPAPFFWLAFLAAGAGLHLSLYALCRLIGVPRLGAAAAASLFALSPASILFENLLFYTYPAAALVVMAALFVGGAFEGRDLHLWAFMGALCALTLTLSLFQLLFPVAWAGLLLAVRGQPRRRKVLVLGPLLLLAALPYVRTRRSLGASRAAPGAG
jgi:hypothetical protein